MNGIEFKHINNNYFKKLDEIGNSANIGIRDFIK